MLAAGAKLPSIVDRFRAFGLARDGLRKLRPSGNLAEDHLSFVDGLLEAAQ